MHLFISDFKYGQKIGKTYCHNCACGASGGTDFLFGLRFLPADAVWGYIYGRTEK